MFEILKAGGWLIVPILLCSIVSVAIVAERLWSLQKHKIMPSHLVARIFNWHKNNELTLENIRSLRTGSPLGRMLAAGLMSRDANRAPMQQGIEYAWRHEVHELERYLTSLGTIAAITPLLGLFGSVLGLMEVFASMSIQSSQGIGNPQALGAGISQIMIATAAGLLVAIPSLAFYRYFQRRVDELAIGMEQQAQHLLGLILGQCDFSLAPVINT